MYGRIAAIAALLFACLSSVSAAAPAPRPNFVVVLTDDQGWGDLGVNGNVNLKTPHIDSLARDGAAFDRFFVCPVCSPTRAEFLTGRYHARCGVRDVSTGGERLNLDEKTIADSFRDAGYATACFGKWHNGTQYPYHPLGRGFAEYYGFTSGHWGEYFNPPLDRNGKPTRGQGYVTDDFTSKAIEFIERNAEAPFFCYVAYNTPHSPMQVPDVYWNRFKDRELKLRYLGPQAEDLQHTRAALAMCENIDDNVGRLLETLERKKLAERTVFLYFCDNGPNGWRWNGGMKGRKGSTDEGGVRSPLLVRWPGRIPSGTRLKTIAGAIDLKPTLTSLAGISSVGDKPLDGINLARQLLGDEPSPVNRMLFSHWAGRVSVRTQTHRLDDSGKLYDMIGDPGQTRDIAKENAEVAKRLQAAVAKWRSEVLSQLPAKDDRPFLAGYRELPFCTLPARDGKPHGGVKRSARAPNCSYFTNWTSTDDSLTWDVEIKTAGRYEVSVYYACPKVDVGSSIELSFGEARLRGKVAEAHDPPQTGAADDRVSRGPESYVKDFKPLNLGAVNLPKNRGLLTLRATEIPGKQVMEVRSVVLTLLD